MIAYFVYHLDGYSGAAKQAFHLAKRLNEEIVFFNFNNSRYRNYRCDGFQIIDLPYNKILQFFIIFSLTIKKNIRVFHFHGFFIAGMLVSMFFDCKLIQKTTLFGDDDFGTFALQKNWKIRKFFLNKINKNIVLTKQLLEINSLYMEREKIILIPNGVFIPPLCFDIQYKSNLFCFVGMVCPRKKTYESIRYFVDNYSQYSQYTMYIVGPYCNCEENIEYDNEYANLCMDFVKKSSLEDRIIFKGKLGWNETQYILSKSKGLLFFSEKEGLPNVILEAMANNCVPITSDMSGVAREVFTHGEDGFIIDADCPSVPISAIENLIEKKKPYIRALRDFSMENIARQYDALYRM